MITSASHSVIRRATGILSDLDARSVTDLLNPVKLNERKWKFDDKGMPVFKVKITLLQDEDFKKVAVEFFLIQVVKFVIQGILFSEAVKKFIHALRADSLKEALTITTRNMKIVAAVQTIREELIMKRVTNDTD